MFSLTTRLCPWGFKSHSLDPKGLPVSLELWTSANGELEGGTLSLFPPAPLSDSQRSSPSPLSCSLFSVFPSPPSPLSSFCLFLSLCLSTFVCLCLSLTSLHVSVSIPHSVLTHFLSSDALASALSLFSLPHFSPPSFFFFLTLGCATWHVGSSLTRNGMHPPPHPIGNVASQPLDQQGSPLS